jgi:hypothetical protein
LIALFTFRPVVVVVVVVFMIVFSMTHCVFFFP